MKILAITLIALFSTLPSFSATEEQLVVATEWSASTQSVNALLKDGWKVKHVSTTHARPGNTNSLFITLILERELPTSKIPPKVSIEIPTTTK